MVFGKGDNVRVVRVVWTQEGWKEAWQPRMTESVNQIFVVTDAQEGHGIELDNGYWYPASALEMVYQ